MNSTPADSRARRQPYRLGPSTETVITALEDAEDYKAFEAAIIADYDAQSAVERELVLRLASVLWRLRRATAMETGLFEIQYQHLSSHRHDPQMSPNSQQVVHAVFGLVELNRNSETGDEKPANPASRGSYCHDVELTRCFLGLVDLPNFALDRLSRYEAALWRQAAQILFALDALAHRKTISRRFRFY